ncbi:hypothetical protein NC653_000258 [Populus alba x Populus x berolinensis]|uniref:Reverse transcriptase domain-containing protein n=1 Tax=Populus alba x Populus x berolinensis TaxID=444605 RepID=A0AAD6RI90_9ROSI|nr:hypothetical protein NC653_000258 [Populus alba x Populus x berolinensis]
MMLGDQKERRVQEQTGPYVHKLILPSSLPRKAKSSILKIHHNGNTFDSQQGIKPVAVDYFSELYDSPSERKPQLNPLGFKCLSKESSEWLEQEITTEEVKHSVWGCDGSKNPGLDGFNFKFYRLAWDFIAQDILDIVLSFFKIGRLPKGINTTYVTLLPKTVDPTKFKDFRLISMIHGIYKIIAKILMSRLKIVMQDIISINQSMFIAYCNIIDGFMIANKLMSNLKKRKAVGLIFKIDFHKAFDSISWDYLDDIMGYMRFGRKWRNMIYECLSSSKLSVLINGSPSKEFYVWRGLRQGDPISPFLFDIVVEGLSALTVLFQKAYSGNISKGLQFALGICLSHLQYVEDTLIFIPTDID